MHDSTTKLYVSIINLPNHSLCRLIDIYYIVLIFLPLIILFCHHVFLDNFMFLDLYFQFYHSCSSDRVLQTPFQGWVMAIVSLEPDQTMSNLVSVMKT